VSHSGVHVGFGTLDMIVQVVTEELDVRDGRLLNGGVGEVAREEDKGDITDIFALSERKMTNFKRRVSVGIKDLRRILNRGLSSSINEFLKGGLLEDPR